MDRPSPTGGSPVIQSMVVRRGLRRMLAAGCWLENTADAARVWPKLVKSSGALRLARFRSRDGVTFPYESSLYGSVTPSNRASPAVHRARYRRPGSRQGWQRLVYDPRQVPDLQSWLTERLGPVEVELVGLPAETVPIEAVAAPPSPARTVSIVPDPGPPPEIMRAIIAAAVAASPRWLSAIEPGISSATRAPMHGPGSIYMLPPPLTPAVSTSTAMLR